MKFKYILTTVILSATLFTSCTDGFESDNTDPNNPIAVPTYGIFNNATKQIVNYSRGNFASARGPLPWMNYTAQMEYTEEDRYAVRSGTEGSLFDQYYYQASNFKKLTEFADNGIATPYGSPDNVRAAARIVSSYIFLNLVDTFGDVPYWSYGNKDSDFQALDVANVAPKYASQEKIYADILNELKTAAASIDMSLPIFNGAENTFNNDPAKLKKFANSLRLRVANRVKGYAPLAAVAQQHIQELIADPSQLMTSNNDSVGVTFEANTINPAPQYNAFFISNRNDYTVSNQFVNLLKGTVTNSGITVLDPRLPIFAMKKGSLIADAKTATYPIGTTANDFVGIPFGIPSTEAQNQTGGAALSFLSFNVLKPNYTEYYMEYAEVEFLLSENLGWDDAHYKNGVQASLDKWEVDAVEAANYITALPPATQATVMTQKYVALFMQGYEAWAEYRRTGFPTFIVKPGDTVELLIPIANTTITSITFKPDASLSETFTDLPRRLRYPYQQETLNGAQYNAAAANIGGDKMTTKLIYDKNY